MPESSWKRDFARGLVVIAPILVVLVLFNWLYAQLNDLPVIRDYAEPWGVLLFITVLTLLTFSIGYLMRTTLGNFFEEGLDEVMNQVPGVRIIYNASKMAVETAVSGTDDLQAPVKVETWNGMRMTAFKTGKRTKDGRDLLFIPTSPNITTGFVVEVTRDQYVETDETVEEALTRVLSAGFGDSKRGVPIAVTDEDIADAPEKPPVETPSTDSTD